MTPCQKCGVGANRKRGQTFYFQIDIQEQNRLIHRGGRGFYHRTCFRRIMDDLITDLVAVGPGKTP